MGGMIEGRHLTAVAAARDSLVAPLPGAASQPGNGTFMPAVAPPLLNVEDLHVSFATDIVTVRAVEGSVLRFIPARSLPWLASPGPANRSPRIPSCGFFRGPVAYRKATSCLKAATFSICQKIRCAMCVAGKSR